MWVSSGVYRVRMATGGAGYAAPPTVSFSGGGGTGAAAVAQMAGTVVQSVVITSAGTGYTSSPSVVLTRATSDMAGTGAAATASVLSLTTPVCMFRGRFNDMYGVNGQDRGFRWDGDTPTLEPLGISKPLAPPSVATATATTGGYVRSVSIIAGGAGYFAPPEVKFSGGGLTDGDPNHATARAKIMNARVIGMTVDSRGGRYSSAPSITFSGGVASGATLNVGVSGSLSAVEITARGSGYTSAGTKAATATVSGGGITGASVQVGVDADGGISSVTVLASGTGATTTPTVTVNAGAGTGASLTPLMTYTVTSVTCATTQAGSNFLAAPAVSFRPDGGGAVALATVSGGRINSPLEVTRGGAYATPPTAVVDGTSARAIAIVDSPMRGVYKCCLRYVDDTTEARQGPIPSSISDFVDVSAPASTNTFTWAWSNDGAESRVHAIELWRTTSDQAIMLYRVATLQKVNGVLPNTYTESLSDDDLLNLERTDFGMMPIVMPSGQLNARRFDPPPARCSQAVMFQDRAWYSVDSTRAKPNSLWHSEIDEPESVPEEYEIVVQESLGQSDAIVALIPFGSSLLVAQSRHLYRLTYVAQPVIDASVRLAFSRGILNARCYAVMSGVAYIADAYGLYAYDGDQREDISVAVDNYWRDSVIDFSKADACFVHADADQKVVRFFYCRAGDGTRPRRALCFGVATKAWWEEEYAQEVACGTTALRTAKPTALFSSQHGGFLAPSSAALDAATTGTTSIPYQFRTGNHALADEPNRSIGVLYRPTADSAEMAVRLHYNNSPTPRDNAIVSSRGDGFTQSATGAVLDLKSMRSALGASPGYAQAYFSGRVDDRSAGGDRHIAVGITGMRATTEPVVLYGITINGVSG